MRAGRTDIVRRQRGVVSESTKRPFRAEIVKLRSNSQEALTDLFGNSPPTNEAVNPNPGQQPQTEDVAALLDKAATAFSDADKALKDGDLATYQKKIKEGEGYVQEARTKSGSSSSGGKSSASTTTTTQLSSA